MMMRRGKLRLGSGRAVLSSHAGTGSQSAMCMLLAQTPSTCITTCGVQLTEAEAEDDGTQGAALGFGGGALKELCSGGAEGWVGMCSQMALRGCK